MSRRSFTLIEVLIAVALLVALSGAMGTFAYNLLRSRDRIMTQARSEAGVGLLMDRLEHDLTWCIAGNSKDGPGIKGSAGRVEILRRDVKLLDGQVAVGVTRKAQYRHEGDTVFARADDGPDEIVASGIKQLRLRYHDGREWQREFDSGQAGTLPVAIAIAVWFGSGLIDQTEADEFGMLDTPTEPDRRRVMVVPDGPSAAWAREQGSRP